MTKFHSFDINTDREDEFSVTLIEDFRPEIGDSMFDFTISSGEIPEGIDEEDLLHELEEIAKTEEGSGETFISLNKESYHVFYELDE